MIQALWDGQMHLSHSSLEAFIKSPAHFIQYKTRMKEKTPAMLFGQLFHCMVLEPDEVEERFAVAPNCDRRTKEGKAEYSAFLLECGSREIVSHSDFETAARMKEAVYANDASSWVLDRITRTEVKVEWNQGGFQWVGFQDGAGDGVLLDLKTIADADPRKVERAIRYEGYARQAAHYTIGAGYPAYDYYLVAIDKSCHVTTARVKEGTIGVAWDEIKYYTAALKRCMLNNDWSKSYDFWGPAAGIFEI